ncbi:MAG: selenocysteine-specific translation elongation factor [Acidobacteriia bacterium]|nr:selenocysteine-specific translation elongation factor [Terriglobia bacterium]
MKPVMKYVIVGTAGHIDHGKTALVKALTGVDCDRWEEEKRRGITIDIGFAGMDLDAATHLAFVDVPGHERFVKNMLAGAQGIDLLLLVVAADESIMPQTREHFEIAKLLEVKTGMSVITKSDLVDSETVALVTAEVRDLLKGSFLADQPIVSVSSRTGAGLDELRTTLRGLAQDVRPKNLNGYFRLPIDRAFSMKGFGAVVTGTLISGQVSRDEEVEILPQKQRARVRGLQVHNRPVTTAVAGQRTAINLQGVETDELTRGMVLACVGTFAPTTRMDVQLQLLPSAPAALKNYDRVHLHLGTAETIATVHLLEGGKLAPGEIEFAQISLKHPTLSLPGDHFVIRRLSPMVTIGGGVVLDPAPSKHLRLTPGALAFLQAVTKHDLEQSLLYLISESETSGVTADDLVARTGIRKEVLRAQMDALANQQKILYLTTRIVSKGALQGIQERLAEIVTAYHARQALATGISKQELKVRLGPKVSGEVFEMALAEAVRAKILEVTGDVVHQSGRRVEFSAEEEVGRKVILEAFLAAGLTVPSVDEVLAKLKIDRTRAKQIVQLLVREGFLVRVTTELMFHADSVAELKRRLQARKGSSSRLSITEFKGLTGVSRKYAIPLLEYLDRERVTRREGDERLIL